MFGFQGQCALSVHTLFFQPLDLGVQCWRRHAGGRADMSISWEDGYITTVWPMRCGWWLMSQHATRVHRDDA